MKGEAKYSVICLEGVQLSAVIGCEEWERRSPKRLMVDVVFAVDALAAIQTDEVQNTVDYGRVAQQIMAFAAESQFHLLESLVDGMADLILMEFSVPWVHLRLSKPGVMSGVERAVLVLERTHPEVSHFDRSLLPYLK